MGEVSKTWDPTGKRFVVVKLVPAGMGIGPQVLTSRTSPQKGECVMDKIHTYVLAWSLLGAALLLHFCVCEWHTPEPMDLSSSQVFLFVHATELFKLEGYGYDMDRVRLWGLTIPGIGLAAAAVAFWVAYQKPDKKR